MSDDTEIRARQKHVEETWKTKTFKIFYKLVIFIIVILVLFLIFGKGFWVIPGLGIFDKYVKYMSIPIVVMVTVFSVPFWWYVLEKIGLFVRGYVLQLGNLPIVDKIQVTSKKSKEAKFFYDGQPLDIRYKEKSLGLDHVEFSVRLGEWKTIDELMNIYKENVLYKSLLKEYAALMNKVSDDLIDDLSLVNVKERLLKGDVEELIKDVAGSVFITETEDNLQTERK